MAFDKQKVLELALAEVGYLEKASNKSLDSKTANPGSKNYTKYNRDMHKIYPSVMDFPAPWCDAFVDWCMYQAYGVANAKALLGGNFDDYTVASAQLYKNKGAWHTAPKSGDQIFFKNSTGICHTGIVYKVAGNIVYTVEGNSNNQVRKRSYKLTDPSIAGYGRPLWDATDAQTAKIASPAPAANAAPKAVYVRTTKTVYERSEHKLGRKYQVRKISAGVKLKIVKVYKSLSRYWGQLENGNWVSLRYTDYKA